MHLLSSHYRLKEEISVFQLAVSFSRLWISCHQVEIPGTIFSWKFLIVEANKRNYFKRNTAQGNHGTKRNAFGKNRTRCPCLLHYLLQFRFEYPERYLCSPGSGGNHIIHYFKNSLKRL